MAPGTFTGMARKAGEGIHVRLNIILYKCPFSVLCKLKLTQSPHTFPYLQAETFLKEHMLPAYYGEVDCVRSVLCAFSSSAGMPCKACTILDHEHKVKRAAQRASERLAALPASRDGGKVTVPSNEIIRRAGLREFFESLMTVTAALKAERQGMLELDKKIEKQVAELQDSRDRLRVYAEKEASRSQLVRLLDEAHRKGAFGLSLSFSFQRGFGISRCRLSIIAIGPKLQLG